MKATCEREPGSRAVLEIEVAPEEMEDEIRRAYRRLAQRMRVPGFRKGHVPAAVLDRYVGKAAVRQEALDPLVRWAYREAVTAEGLVPVDTPQFDVQEFGDEGPLRLQARVVVRPDVRLGDVSKIRVPRGVRQVRTEDVDAALEDVRLQRGTWIPCEDAAGPGDLVVLRISGRLEDGTAVDEQNVEGIVGDGSIRKEIDEAVAGRRPGEEADTEFVLAAADAGEQRAGTMARVHVQVREVKHRELPELTDAFAAELFDGATLESLRAQLEEQLRGAAERQADQTVIDQATRLAVEAAEVEIPEVMIERQISSLLEDVVRRTMRSAGLRLGIEDYARLRAKSVEELRAEYREMAESQIRTELVLQEIARQRELNPDQDEVDREIARLAEEQHVKLDRFRRMAEEPQNMAAIRDSLRRAKVLQYLAQVATGAESPPADANQGGESA